MQRLQMLLPSSLHQLLHARQPWLQPGRNSLPTCTALLSGCLQAPAPSVPAACASSAQPPSASSLRCCSSQVPHHQNPHAHYLASSSSWQSHATLTHTHSSWPRQVRTYAKRRTATDTTPADSTDTTITTAVDAPPDAASNPAPPMRISIQEALVKLVDAAVDLVEQDKQAEAIAVLEEGITTLGAGFANSPELGELHNQVGLLKLVSGDADGAAEHARKALELTQKKFGTGGALTGHRLLRLGVAYVAQGRLTDAAGLLHGAETALTDVDDSSMHEATFYINLIMLAGASSAAQVAEYDQKLITSLKALSAVFGANAMIMSLALSQHDRVVHQPLGQPEPDYELCEALLRQHAKLLEEVNPGSEDLAMCQYKLATFYYTHDMLPSAERHLRDATHSLQTIYSDEHDLLALCKHRLGMIRAAAGDHRTAVKLLQASRGPHGTAQLEDGSSRALSGLAREAEYGLALAKFRGLPPSAELSTKQAELAVVREKADALAAAIGARHMLVRGALRYLAQASRMAEQ